MAHEGTSNGSIGMSRLCSGLQCFEYHPIWIDCEEHHTTEGVVSDILDQIIVRDPTFPPLLMQMREPAVTRTLERGGTDGEQFDPAALEQIARAVLHIREGLKRGRYVLCFDSPEAFGRPQTVQHGIPDLLLAKEEIDKQDTGDYNRLQKIFVGRVTSFFTFLEMLFELTAKVGSNAGPFDVGESYLSVVLDLPTRRHGGVLTKAKTSDYVLRRIRRFYRKLNPGDTDRGES